MDGRRDHLTGDHRTDVHPSNLVTQPLHRLFTVIQFGRYPPTKINNLRMDVAEFHTRADISQRARAAGMGALARETLSSFQIEADGSSSAPDGSQLWQPMDVAEDFAVRFTGLRFLSLVASHGNSCVSPPLHEYQLKSSIF